MSLLITNALVAIFKITPPEEGGGDPVPQENLFDLEITPKTEPQKEESDGSDVPVLLEIPTRIHHKTNVGYPLLPNIPERPEIVNFEWSADKTPKVADTLPKNLKQKEAVESLLPTALPKLGQANSEKHVLETNPDSAMVQFSTASVLVPNAPISDIAAQAIPDIRHPQLQTKVEATSISLAPSTLLEGAETRAPETVPMEHLRTSISMPLTETVRPTLPHADIATKSRDSLPKTRDYALTVPTSNFPTVSETQRIVPVASPYTSVVPLTPQSTELLNTQDQLAIGPGPNFASTPKNYEIPAPQSQPITAPNPQSIATQITTSITQTNDEIIEIRLDPPELGKLIVTITHKDSGISAHILAERADITELLRRNADVLSREFEKSGLNSASLEFSHQEKHPETDSTPENHQTHSNDTSSQDAEVPLHRSIPINLHDGLDIRL